MKIFTIGHSNLPIESFITLLRKRGISLLADIRSIPFSRHNPQYNQQPLAAALEEAGIEYRHLIALGGRRQASPHSRHLGLPSGFRGYADHMSTEEFQESLQWLIGICRDVKLAIMCAEAQPMSCHRSLTADALTAQHVRVRHILGDGTDHLHQLTESARIDGHRVIYPAAQQELLFN